VAAYHRAQRTVGPEAEIMTTEELAGVIYESAQMSRGRVSLAQVLHLMRDAAQGDDTVILPSTDEMADAVVWLVYRGYGSATLDDAGMIAGFRMTLEVDDQRKTTPGESEIPGEA
jgi:hypothetical protein